MKQPHPCCCRHNFCFGVKPSECSFMKQVVVCEVCPSLLTVEPILPVAMVTGIQIAIVVLGKFSQDQPLENYVPCLEKSIELRLKESGVDVDALNGSLQRLPDNFTNYPVIKMMLLGMKTMCVRKR